MDDRIRFITHRGKQILMVDLSQCKAAEVKEISTLVPKFVTAQPKGSVLLLADFTGAEFDRDAITHSEKRHGFRSAASEAVGLGGNGKLA